MSYSSSSMMATSNQPVQDFLNPRPQVFENAPQGAVGAWLQHKAQTTQAPILMVVPDAGNIDGYLQEFRSRRLDVGVLRFDEHNPYAGSANDSKVTSERWQMRNRFTQKVPKLLLTHATALPRRWPSSSELATKVHSYGLGASPGRDALCHTLSQCGYTRTNSVEDHGTFSVRGSVIDIAIPGQKYGIRVDLFGDDIETLTYFSKISQRNVGRCARFSVGPIRDVIFDKNAIARAKEGLWSLADTQNVPTKRVKQMVEESEHQHYFFGIEHLWPLFWRDAEPVANFLCTQNPEVLVIDPEGVEDAITEHYALVERDYKKATERHELCLPIDAHYAVTDLRPLSTLKTTAFKTLADDQNDEVLAKRFEDIDALAQELAALRKGVQSNAPLSPLKVWIQKQLDAGRRTTLVCQTEGLARTLRELLRERSIDVPFFESFERASRERLAITQASVPSGYIDLELGHAVVCDREIFGSKRQRNKKNEKKSERLIDLKSLQPGDYVVHTDFGIGLYHGIRRMALGGIDGDYVHLEYDGGDKLYLPIFRIALLQPYRAPPGTRVRLERLGKDRWLKTKQKVKDQVLAIAHRVLSLEGSRRAQTGAALPPPNDAYFEFSQRFEFEETEDQEKAIEDIISDLGAGAPMDRLICGDVGFGKTEVALRAAFLCAIAEKQIAVLVPTTVLAEQHGIRFRERFAQEPITIDVLSRFRTKAELNAIKTRLKLGATDIVVGTHRLLSAGLEFKDLGMLIIDEEQRFGVKQKSRLKELKVGTHVLTLSATPIPRTLHMAMMGLRDLSLIKTPPTERTPIKTEVTRFDEGVIQEAIRRELGRGGQVFVVHNRVQSIEAMTKMVQKLVPEAKVAFAHGQMGSEKLESLMVRFMNHEFNVLVCTTIIESGIDIPSVNTMIVNRADTFGLSQLHQLRGRIGRSSVRAYAYLLLPRSQGLTKDASARLAVLKRFSDLGAGFQIASHDLDLRGAGDLLGKDQSGQIAAVGYELYMELLEETVHALQSGEQRHEIEPEMQLPVVAILPEAFIERPGQRLEYYQRLSGAENEEDIFNLRQELRELYGELPPEVETLVEVMSLRRWLIDHGAVYLSASIQKQNLIASVAFLEHAAIDRAALAIQIQKGEGGIHFTPSGRIAMSAELDTELPQHIVRKLKLELKKLPFETRSKAG